MFQLHILSDSVIFFCKCRIISPTRARITEISMQFSHDNVKIMKEKCVEVVSLYSVVWQTLIIRDHWKVLLPHSLLCMLAKNRLRTLEEINLFNFNKKKCGKELIMLMQEHSTLLRPSKMVVKWTWWYIRIGIYINICMYRSGQEFLTLKTVTVVVIEGWWGFMCV